MAGEWLMNQINKRGGHDSELADVMFGKVKSLSPLVVSLNTGLDLPAQMLPMGRVGKRYPMPVSGLKVTFTDTFYPQGKDGPAQSKTTTYPVDGSQAMFDDSLHIGDGVVLVRHGNGQQFWIADKTV